MNRSAQRSRISLVIVLAALLWSQSPVGAQNPAPTPTPTATPQRTADDVAGQKVKLYYMREATKIVAVLTAIATKGSSVLEGLVMTNPTEDEIILYGPQEKRTQARRIIATLDLPRPGILMEMWGVQITSRNPENMAKVMALVRQEINRTQQTVREVYGRLELLTRQEISQDKLNEEFRKVLVDELFYRSALSADHPLSLADVLLRMTAAEKPSQAVVSVANGLEKWIHDNHRVYLDELNKRSGEVKNQKIAVAVRPPFERFFSGRGFNSERQQLG
jgi:hypothetical protein